MTSPLVRYVPAPDTLTTGDNAVALGHAASRYLVRNRSGRTVYVEADATASLDSTAVLHSRSLVVDGAVSVLHLYVTADTSLDDTGEAGVEVTAWAALDAFAPGLPHVVGPYVVTTTELHHENDTTVLFTPAVGDLVLAVIDDQDVAVDWDHGTLNVGTAAAPTKLYNTTPPGAFNFCDFCHGSYVATAAEPLQVKLTGTGGTDATVGHVEFYAFLSRAVAPV